MLFVLGDMKLVDPETVLPRKEQEFRIEAESVHFALVEDKLHCVPAESLQTRLGIMEWKVENEPRQMIE